MKTLRYKAYIAHFNRWPKSNLNVGVDLEMTVVLYANRKPTRIQALNAMGQDAETRRYFDHAVTITETELIPL